METHDDTDEYNFRNGKKKLKIDLKQDLESWQEISLKVVLEGKEVSAKGRVNIYYKGPTYRCRECEETH